MQANAAAANNPERNPKIGWPLRAVLLVVVPLLLVSGGALFFLTEATRLLWPWDIGPFNALFLGGFYLASGLGIAVAVWGGRWFPARIITPMMFVFTATVALVTLLQFSRYNLAHWTTYAWFAIFIGLPLASGAALVRYRTWPVPLGDETPSGWRAVLVVLGSLYLLYGAALFLFPTTVGAHWPWPLDSLHAQTYSAVFTASAVALLGLSGWAAPIERLTLGIAASALGLLAIFGLVIGDAARHTVAWGRPGVWVWLALFGAFFLIGLALVWWSSSARPAKAKRL
jgi:hypothetical protein